MASSFFRGFLLGQRHSADDDGLGANQVGIRVDSGSGVRVAYAWRMRQRGVRSEVEEEADEDLAKAGEYGWVNGELGWVERTGRELQMDDDWTCCTSGGQANDVGMGKKELTNCLLWISHQELGGYKFPLVLPEASKKSKAKKLAKALDTKEWVSQVFGYGRRLTLQTEIVYCTCGSIGSPCLSHTQ